MNTTNKEELVRITFEKCKKVAFEIWRANLYSPMVRWDIVSERMRGQFRPSNNLVRLNPGFYRKYGEKYAETIAHEYAHYLVQFMREHRGHHAKELVLDKGFRSHGQLWKAVMKSFGYNGDRASKYAVDSPKGEEDAGEYSRDKDPVIVAFEAARPYKYDCGCRIHNVSKRMHNNIRYRGMSYRCKLCKGDLKQAGLPSKIGV